jgi:hypothetical protein
MFLEFPMSHSGFGHRAMAASERAGAAVKDQFPIAPPPRAINRLAASRIAICHLTARSVGSGMGTRSLMDASIAYDTSFCKLIGGRNRIWRFIPSEAAVFGLARKLLLIGGLLQQAGFDPRRRYSLRKLTQARGLVLVLAN